jgi:hypothetical protein
MIILQQYDDNFFLHFSPPAKYVSKNVFSTLYEDALRGHVSKHAFFISNLDHKLLNSTFMNSLATMKNEKLTKSIFLKLGKRNPFLNHLNHVMDRSIPFGIPQHLCDAGYSDIYRQYDAEVDDNRRILSLTDVEFGFVIWLATFPLSIIAFICEIKSIKVKRLARKYAGLIEFLLLLRARMSVYHD